MASHMYLRNATRYLQVFNPNKILTTSMRNTYRNYSSTTVEQEIEVPTFCDIDINVPFSINIKPLNVHKYHNLDKLLIKIDKEIENNIECEVNGTSVKIFGKGEDVVKAGTICSIKAPVKANLNVVSKQDINIGFFNGDKVSLKSTNGNIVVDRFQGTSIDVTTHSGDITLNNYIQASDISANIIIDGSIKTERLQGLYLKLNTKNGDIAVESSYCAESHFTVEKGNMYLYNIHKCCELLLNTGNLHLTGFDGQLLAVILNGSADMHLSRITGNSEILIKELGNLNLKLTEACQDYCKFEIKTEDCVINTNIKSTISRGDKNVILTPEVEEENVVLVNVPNGKTIVESTSWQDMMKLKMKKSKEGL